VNTRCGTVDFAKIRQYRPIAEPSPVTYLNSSVSSPPTSALSYANSNDSVYPFPLFLNHQSSLSSRPSLALYPGIICIIAPDFCVVVCELERLRLSLPSIPKTLNDIHLRDHRISRSVNVSVCPSLERLRLSFPRTSPLSMHSSVSVYSLIRTSPFIPSFECLHHPCTRTSPFIHSDFLMVVTRRYPFTFHT